AVDSLSPPPADFIPYAYPPHYVDLIASFSRDPHLGVERALLQAVAWQESRFDSGAVSRAGAVGLTQLTANTVATIAQRLREHAPGANALIDPRLNLHYGAYHLKQLIDRFHG